MISTLMKLLTSERCVPTMKFYISGKITGQANYLSLFRLAEIELKRLGYKALNPTLLPANHDKTWNSFMREDLKALLDCDGIYMLDNHSRSPGAMIELRLAQSLNFKVLYQ